ncbi:MAG: methionyl-tRNA formyltransferase [Sulfurimicrobium sp.]|jgi:methionyl-tRNA formyltransferase|nr:methionyl-tRNA formyltransferase [Sulfurimicrobium sp.]MDO9190937.1 methionyl-tRNA formyltransferase [Sulfurimicrobium sp.]MDP1703734.1 methionyl-tRNA formyltransferase [Sulfurimicrobium sp.]MDP2200338.1 methionyl-tRNA formyltransferase [Sulfurimicrobium sp.]MDP2963663.1 methionyl-tRNA formyltransferase [Sulfurimicrobium sp.]
MKLIFAGTPVFAAQALQALLHAGHEVKLVLTQPDRPAGRGMSLTMSPVKQMALANGLNVQQPVSLRHPEIQAQLAAVQADAMIVAAYGLILPREVLAIPPLGCLNIHASLLPRWRGAAPIQRAILAGDVESGITIMQMDEGLDTGPMLLRFPLPIEDKETAQTLHDKLAALGAEAIVSALQQLEQGVLPGQIQDDSLATYAAKLSKAEARLDWSLPAQKLERAVRAYNPFPVAQSSFKGELWRIWQAVARDDENGPPGEVLRAGREGLLVGCGQGALLLQELQKAGGKRLPAAQFLQGNPVKAGERFDLA